MRFLIGTFLAPAAAQLLLPIVPPELFMPGLAPTNGDVPPVLQTAEMVPPGWPEPPNPFVPAPAENVVKQEGFCADAAERQSSGYLSAGIDVSYFFWLMRSESKGPRPLLLWLSGGPGCSSSLALLLENGPCKLDGQRGDGSWESHRSPHSWTQVADVVWVDQPSNTGYSAGTNISRTEEDVGEHMFVFLKNFFARFPELRSSPFYVTGESYGGHYVPAVAARLTREIKLGVDPPMRLDGIAIGNGLVDPLVQTMLSPDMAYTGGAGGSLGHGVITEAQYADMNRQMRSCETELRSCQAQNIRDCITAVMDCMRPTMTPIVEAGYNPYDLRKQCPPGLAPICLNVSNEINFLNDPAIQDALGVKPHRTWVPCSMATNMAFLFSGDEMQSAAPLVAELLEAEVPVLVYYGDTDYMCHWVGGKAWASQLAWPHRDAWAAAEDRDWMVDGKLHGKQRSLSGFTFLQIFDSGHLVPSDQPEAALAMMKTFMTKGNSWEAPVTAQLEAKLARLSVVAIALTAMIAVAAVAGLSTRRFHRGSSEAYTALTAEA